MTANTIPVYSDDGRTWRHFPAWNGNRVAKEGHCAHSAEQDTLWIAHMASIPTPHCSACSPGSTVQSTRASRSSAGPCQGRTTPVTVTEFNVADDAKKVVWLQARQHAWEAGTSQVLEAALRFVTSDDEKARELRRRVVFKFTPMVDPDGCANGGVRFNANGYDVNRHWDEVDLRDKEKLRLMPENRYVKRAIYAQMDSRPSDRLDGQHA